MQAKGVIKKQVPWAQSRSFFYWRLRRRLAEFDIAKRIHAVSKSSSSSSAALDKGYRKKYIAKFQEWFAASSSADPSVLESDRGFVEWAKENSSKIDDFVKKESNVLLKAALTATMTSLLDTANGDPQILAEALKGLSASRAEQFLNLLKASAGSDN